MKIKTPLYTRVLSVALLVTIFVAQLLPISNASAGQITLRSLELQAQSSSSDGGSKAGGVVNHKFTFTVPNLGSVNIGSIKFEYCTLAAGVPNPDTCVMPNGLVTTSASMGIESPEMGWSLNNTTNGAPFIHRIAASVAPGAVISATINTVTNPTDPTFPVTSPYTFYVRIKTYTSTDVSGTATDAGTVAATTAEQIVLDGVMPESLVFCAGATVTTSVANGGNPDCATATTGVIHFNKLFSPTDTATSTSQMAASTNAGSGYVITVNGPTMTSGTNTIAPMNSNEVDLHGVGQFGLNLMLNTIDTVSVGADVALAPNGTTLQGEAATNYSAPNSFKFTSGNTVADSYNGGIAGKYATDAQIFTVTYIVNVPGSQPAGTYVTTLTYICTPTF